MEIKYDASGQPLPESQQDWAKTATQTTPIQAARAQGAISGNTGAGGQVGIKEFKEIETPDEFAGPITDHQLSNPFVQEYIKNKNKPDVAQVTQLEAAVQEEVVEQVEEAVEILPEPKKEDHPNFKALRQQAEQAARERDELARLLRERDLRDQQLPRKVESVDVDSDDLDLAEDAYPEPKHIKKLNQKTKILEKKLAEYEQKTARTLQETLLYRNYPDIDSVLSPDNIASLRETRPAYARQVKALHDAGDVYGAGEMAYNYMMDLGIHQSSPKASSGSAQKDYTLEKMRVQQNASKPRPLVSGTAKQESPLAKAHAFNGELTAADMKKYYAEMESAIRNRGD